MSIHFAANISTLRREKNISQRNAAQALGVSQALLSHYEKGIRECSLDFVVRAAQFYDVTADYLLGLSPSKHGSNEIFEAEPMPGDTQIKIKTVLRSFLQLVSATEKKGEDSEVYFNDFFSLCIKKYILSLENGGESYRCLCDMAENMLSLPQNTNSSVQENEASAPLCTKTVEAHAFRLIKTKFEQAIK